jgi:hypothetical protein
LDMARADARLLESGGCWRSHGSPDFAHHNRARPGHSERAGA